MKRCNYWDIEAMIEEDMKLVRYSGVEIEEEPTNPEKPCGKCQTCKEYEEHMKNEPDYPNVNPA